ncbi:DUF397 domain-containing protein [Streptomyces sp. NPDC051162]|uniref:DUF397 domain-containing protein n=1 Tax=unclassified Streptomyces TaxID=2593676 RepID=UPI00343D0DB2
MRWRKSSYSGQAGNCLEAGGDTVDVIPIRDSKTPHGPTLLLPADAWADFIRNVKDERFG